MKLPLVSVIIPALNVEKTIDKCLNAIKNLNFPKNRLEIIIVDNGSKDKTVEIAKEFKARIFIKPPLSIGELRNFGARHARGSILAFIDADVIVPRNWIKIGIPYLNEKGVGMTGSLYTIPKNASWIAKTRELMRTRKETGRKAELDWLPAGNTLIKKSTFNKFGGFSHIKTGEDVEFGLRLKEKGFRIISDKRLKSVHLGEPKGAYHFLKRRIWQSSCSVELFFLHKNKRWTMFAFSSYYFLSISFFLASIILVALTKSVALLITALTLLILPAIVLAVKNGLKMRRYNYIPALAVVYLLWGLSNGISIILHRQWRHLAK